MQRPRTFVPNFFEPNAETTKSQTKRSATQIVATPIRNSISNMIFNSNRKPNQHSEKQYEREARSITVLK